MAPEKIAMFPGGCARATLFAIIRGMSILDRTFHPDEANQAFTTGRLLETGTYLYNPQDHHGPTLYYAAAALQKAAGRDSTAALDASLLRCTPILFAILALVFGVHALKRITGRTWYGIIFALMLGTSPIFVFFATDFIQEMLLACFTMLMFWAGTGYLNPGGRLKPGSWALIFGIAAGLAFATKETALLAFAAAGIAAAPFVWRNRTALHGRTRDAVLAFMGFAITATLLYSSFASNWQGVHNAFIAAPLSYLHRAAGAAASQGASNHVHPWWQYLKWLFAADWRFSTLPLLAAFVVTFRSRSFLHLYAIALLLVYSLIPYKTPWCALQIVLPLALAPCAILPSCGVVRRRVAAALLVLAVGINAIGIGVMNRNPDAKEIPYNYASASPQVLDLAALVTERIAANDAFAAVALPPEDTWPLPFYLRASGGKVGYWTQFAELEALAGLGRKPAVVVVPAEEGHLVQPLFPHLTNTKRFEMRPRVRVRVFW